VVSNIFCFYPILKEMIQFDKQPIGAAKRAVFEFQKKHPLAKTWCDDVWHLNAPQNPYRSIPIDLRRCCCWYVFLTVYQTRPSLEEEILKVVITAVFLKLACRRMTSMMQTMRLAGPLETFVKSQSFFWQDELFCFCLERLLFAWQSYFLVSFALCSLINLARI